MKAEISHMVNQKKFESIKKDHGGYASWAIWADEGERPKDNVGDLSIFDIGNYASFIQHLKPNIILVGLNISSRPIEGALGNFHDARPQSQDFKIRYALKDTPFWGAYMTDIIKDFQQKSSGKMMSYLRNDKVFEEENVKTFRGEINDLGVNNPTIVAFGGDAHKVLNRNFKGEYAIHKIPHYSMYISKEKYREEVKSTWENL